MPIILPTLISSVISWGAGFWGEKSAQGDSKKNMYLIGGAVVALLIILFIVFKVL